MSTSIIDKFTEKDVGAGYISAGQFEIHPCLPHLEKWSASGHFAFGTGYVKFQAEYKDGICPAAVECGLAGRFYVDPLDLNSADFSCLIFVSSDGAGDVILTFMRGDEKIGRFTGICAGVGAASVSTPSCILQYNGN